MTPLQYLRAFAPELASVSDGDAGTMITAVTATLTGSAWGDAVFPQAVAYLAAHLLTLQARAAAMAVGLAGAGPLTSAGTGGLSLGFGGGGFTGSEDVVLSTTAHGQQFIRLRNSRAAVAPLLLTV